MSSRRIRRTYSLDVETHGSLELLAESWNLSKSDAVSRAIRIATDECSGADNDGIRALDELQRSLGLDEAAATRWIQQVKDARGR